MINTPTCNNCKELNKYLPILAEEFYRVNKVHGDIFKAKFNHDEIMLGCDVYNFYPAPTLEELLKVSPMQISIDAMPSKPEFKQNQGWYNINSNDKLIYQIPKSENICDKIAELIIKYYKELK